VDWPTNSLEQRHGPLLIHLGGLIQLVLLEMPILACCFYMIKPKTIFIHRRDEQFAIVSIAPRASGDLVVIEPHIAKTRFHVDIKLWEAT
jgi:hypothetical protein